MPNVPDNTKLAVVAALERELRPWVRGWQVCERDYAGRRFRFFESRGRVAVCGGIGAAAARQATEAVIALYRPARVCSAGFAGALVAGIAAGSVLAPAHVISAQDGSRTEIAGGQGTLVTATLASGAQQKSRLAAAYGAQAVDMEAAAVALGAQARGVEFTAVKAISDEYDFELPALDRFLGPAGQFRAAGFALHVALRPWLWVRTLRLARNSARAARNLCAWLEQHPVSGAASGRELRPVTSS